MSDIKVVRSREFTAERAWGALDIACLENVSVRLHWTDRPYVWHLNEGCEVFAVLDGEVEMFYREHGREHCVLLRSGDLFYAGAGCEHVAHPRGEARILVVEKAGSP